MQWISDSSAGDAESGGDSVAKWSLTAVSARSVVHHGWSGSRDMYLRAVPVAGERELVDFAKETHVACDVGDEPMWNERLDISVPRSQIGDPSAFSFHVTVYNDNFLDDDDAEIGHCIVRAQQGDKWHSLKSFRGKAGEVRLIVRKEDEVASPRGIAPPPQSSGYLHISSIKSEKLRRKGIRLHEASVVFSGEGAGDARTMIESDHQTSTIAWDDQLVLPCTPELVERGLCVTAIAADSSMPFAEGVASFDKAAFHESKFGSVSSSCDFRRVSAGDDDDDGDGEESSAIVHKGHGRLHFAYRYLPPVDGVAIARAKAIVFMDEGSELRQFGPQEVFLKVGFGSKPTKYAKSAPMGLACLSQGAIRCPEGTKFRFAYNTKHAFVAPELHIALCLSVPVNGRSVIGECHVPLMDIVHGNQDEQERAEDIVVPLMHSGRETKARVRISAIFLSSKSAALDYVDVNSQDDCIKEQSVEEMAAEVVLSQRVKALKRLFYRIDKDGSGHVQLLELKEAMSAAGSAMMLPPGMSAAALFNQMDTDKSGNVSWSEFRAFALEVSKSAQDHLAVDDAASSVHDAPKLAASAPIPRKTKVKKRESKRGRPSARTYPARVAWTQKTRLQMAPKRPAATRKAVVVDASMRGELNDPQLLREEIYALRKRENRLIEENTALRVAARTAEKSARDKVRDARNEMNGVLFGYQSRAATVGSLGTQSHDDPASMEATLMERMPLYLSALRSLSGRLRRCECQRRLQRTDNDSRLCQNALSARLRSRAGGSALYMRAAERGVAKYAGKARRCRRRACFA